MKSYLGMYDVSSPKLRSEIFKLLSAYGIHQQKSVFECQLSFDLKTTNRANHNAHST